ncbi:DNA pilot protein [Microviridae sp.]|nr:DNA pilot protein [Microviridae sp.]
MFTDILSLGSQLFNSAKDRQQSSRNLRDQQQWERESADLAWERNQQQWNATNQWNLEQWNRQNEYNSPQSQMKRFKDAGLSPHLMYGQGTAGNSGSVTSSQAAPYKRGSPDFSQRKATHLPTDFGEGLSRMYNREKIQAETDRVEAEINLINERTLQESIVNEFGTIGKMFGSTGISGGHAARTATGKSFKAKHDMDLGRFNSDVAKENAKQARLDTENKIISNDLKEAQLLGAQIKNEFEKSGLTSSSSTEMRVLYKRMLDAGVDAKTAGEALLIAGVGAGILKTIVPAGILGNILKKKPIQAPRMKGKSTHKSGDDTYTDYHY